jgi:phosphoenolpyruvate carboxylase
MLQPHLKPADVWKELLEPLFALEQALKLSGSSALAAQSLKKFLYQIVFQGTDIFKCDRRDVFAFEELARTFMEVDAHFEAGYEFERYLEQLMVRLAKKYPKYGLEIHKGYGTKLHREMIKKYGISVIHRSTFCKKLTS